MKKTKQKKLHNGVACALSAAVLAGGVMPARAAEKSSDSFKQVYEFEDANRFSSDYGNAIRNDLFGDYSGSGFVYLTRGWAEVNFTVPTDGKYKITVVSNSDQWKKNWLYLDQDGAGELQTWENRWNETTNEYDLKAGEHKFGVSSDWGYVALDKVIVEKVDDGQQGGGSQGGDQGGNQGGDQGGNQGGNQGGDISGPIVTQGPLQVKGTTLYDGNGNPFVMRGINIAHGWYTDQTEKSINAVAKLGANCVRVVLCDGSQWTKTTEQEVKDIIKWCRDNNLIVTLEIHDYTGFNDPSNIESAVEYWKSLKDILNANKDYVIVNIANEWLGDWEQSHLWVPTYSKAVKDLRAAGIENVLMVDAPGYGQQTAPAINGAKQILEADPQKNTMFSIHMYSVAGADESTVKNNIDSMLNQGVCTVIGEYGNFQNGGNVDEKTIMSYSKDRNVGIMAWSWKGNGGTDRSLDLSNDWDGNNLTDWGKYTFFADGIGIHFTSKMAYTLKQPTGDVTPVDPNNSPDGTGPGNSTGSGSGNGGTVVTPPVDGKTDIEPGLLKSLSTDWFVSPKGSGEVAEKSTITPLEEGGYRVSFDLTEEDYPTLMNLTNGLDLSKNKKLSVIVRNNNTSAIQLQPIFKLGAAYKWTEYDKYQEIPALTTVQVDFDLSNCSNLSEVNGILFRIQGAGAKVKGSVDFLAVAPDLDKAENASQIAELNRPKSASYFSWDYPETSWEAQTTSAVCKDDVISVSFKNVTADNAAGIQTETKPGLGKGMDISPYRTLTCKITNKGATAISASLLARTSGNWTWQENAGTAEGQKDGVTVKPGETVEVTYNLQDSVWKSKASNWQYTGKLQDADDLRALGFKLWSNSTSGVDGQVEISDFSFNF